eukprot:GHVT01076476.1.p1 GENE.GHVT01076476.1~~GHVT01076476.1.p1  ORF type:complete len:710 (+),score=82.72 GHVT01076476.1:250-2379(+)
MKISFAAYVFLVLFLGSFLNIIETVAENVAKCKEAVVNQCDNKITNADGASQDPQEGEEESSLPKTGVKEAPNPIGDMTSVPTADKEIANSNKVDTADAKDEIANSDTVDTADAKDVISDSSAPNVAQSSVAKSGTHDDNALRDKPDVEVEQPDSAAVQSLEEENGANAGTKTSNKTDKRRKRLRKLRLAKRLSIGSALIWFTLAGAIATFDYTVLRHGIFRVTRFEAPFWRPDVKIPRSTKEEETLDELAANSNDNVRIRNRLAFSQDDSISVEEVVLDEITRTVPPEERKASDWLLKQGTVINAHCPEAGADSVPSKESESSALQLGNGVTEKTIELLKAKANAGDHDTIKEPVIAYMFKPKVQSENKDLYVVWNHGMIQDMTFEGDPIDTGGLTEAQGFVNTFGVNVIVPIVPGNLGRRYHETTTVSLANKTVDLAYEYLRKMKIPPRNIVVRGFSMGSANTMTWAHATGKPLGGVLLKGPIVSRNDAGAKSTGLPHLLDALGLFPGCNAMQVASNLQDGGINTMAAQWLVTDNDKYVKPKQVQSMAESFEKSCPPQFRNMKRYVGVEVASGGHADIREEGSSWDSPAQLGAKNAVDSFFAQVRENAENYRKVSQDEEFVIDARKRLRHPLLTPQVGRWALIVAAATTAVALTSVHQVLKRKYAKALPRKATNSKKRYTRLPTKGKTQLSDSKPVSTRFKKGSKRS